jgi:histidinol-phosphate aminotransferase
VIQAKDFLSKISTYKPGRPIEEVARELKLKGEIIKLASNENPLGPSPLALRAIRRFLKDTALYPDDNCYYLKKKVAGLMGLDPGNLIFANGSVELLPMATHAYLGPGDSAVASAGAFLWFKIAVRHTPADLIEVPMAGFRHDLQAMRAAIRPTTRLVYIANPNNPTGTIVTRDEVEEFFDGLSDDLLVIMDEAYIEYIDDPAFPDSLALFRQRKNILILRTFSKIYGLAGARLGFGVASPEVIDSLAKLRISFNVNRFSQVAGSAALDDAGHVRRGKAVNEAGKAYLADAYRRLGLFFLPTYANFFFVDFGRDSQGVFESLLRKGVITRTIKEYGYPNALRISVGTEEQNRRLVRALKSLA